MQPEHFPFLNMSLEVKCHTMFYMALGRLLLVDLGEDEDKFGRFITPLTSGCSFIYFYTYYYINIIITIIISFIIIIMACNFLLDH